MSPMNSVLPVRPFVRSFVHLFVSNQFFWYSAQYFVLVLYMQLTSTNTLTWGSSISRKFHYRPILDRKVPKNRIFYSFSKICSLIFLENLKMNVLIILYSLLQFQCLGNFCSSVMGQKPLSQSESYFNCSISQMSWDAELKFCMLLDIHRINKCTSLFQVKTSQSMSKSNAKFPVNWILRIIWVIKLSFACVETSIDPRCYKPIQSLQVGVVRHAGRFI